MIQFMILLIVFNYALIKNLPLFLSKNTILQKYDEAFKEIFDEVYKKFKIRFEENNLTYQHKLIDDMVACLMEMEWRISLGMLSL